MINKDKFGYTIYPSKFQILLKYGKILVSLGYIESHKKPNLFYKKISEGLFFVDMRGTDEVKIWECTDPLFYCKFGECPLWIQNRLKDQERANLNKNNIPIRLSFYEWGEPRDDWYEMVDKFYGNSDVCLDQEDIYEDGFCKHCNKDMQKEGIFCNTDCKEKFIQNKKKEHEKWIESQRKKCGVCLKKIEYEEEVEHHISYFPEKRIYCHKKCHNKIHKTNKHPDLKPSKEDIGKFYSREIREKICPTCKKSFKDNRKTYCDEKCRPSYKPPRPPKSYKNYLPQKKYESPMLDAWL